MTIRLLAALGVAAFALSPAVATAQGCNHTTYEVVSTHGADTISVGELHLFNRRAIETPPNARNAGGFLSIYNYDSEPNRLVSASSPVAQRVELHTMTMEDDVMRMREVEGGIEVPAETQVDLAPGGLHVMFIGITAPFVEGDEVPVTLTFEGGEVREITLPVQARRMETNHDEHQGHGQGHDHGETN